MGAAGQWLAMALSRRHGVRLPGNAPPEASPGPDEGYRRPRWSTSRTAPRAALVVRAA